MKNVKEEKHLKTKVFISYMLMVALIAGITYFTFSSFRQLTRSADSLAQSNPRIELLHEMIFSIYNAESHIRSYTLSEQEIFLDTYFEELENLNSQVDSLYLLASNDPFFLQVIDTINMELVNKTRLLDQLIKLRRLDENSALYQQALKEIMQTTEESARIRQVQHQTITSPDITESVQPEDVSREKENLFSRVRGLFSGRQQDEKPTENQQALREESLLVQTDSIITIYHDTELLREELANTIQNLARSMIARQQQVMRAENRILRQDKEVMDNIWRLVTRLEDHERNKALGEAANAHLTVRNTTGKIFVILTVSLIILLVFSWLFINDMNRSRFYKYQLIREKNRAESLLKIKQRFMANISHEIRTPLNSIIGFSKQLEKRNNTKSRPEFVKAISQSSEHLLHIVNDILDFSKMEAGRIELENVDFNLEQLCQEVFQTLWVIADEKQLEFSLETNLHEPFLIGDPLRIRQILLNIAGNALKFTPEGSVRITVSDYQSAHDPDMNYVHFKVSDTGIGMSESGLQHIFEEFSQADEKPTRRFGGTGLGLSISKKLSEMMGGKIEVFSKPGEGSTFSVHIPFSIALSDEVTPTEEPAIQSPMISASILLVEDDRLNRMLFQAIFENHPGIKLSEAPDIQTAIKLMTNEKFDLIITDIQMPGMSGHKLIGKLRKQKDWASNSTPAMACTADVTKETEILCKNNGIEAIISKPVEESLLLEKINKLLGHKHQENQGSNAIMPDETIPSHQSATNAAKGFSLEDLQAFTGNNPETIHSILDAFREDTKQNLETLSDALEGKDYETIRKIAHKMSTMFGMLQVQEAFTHLKSLDRENLQDLPFEETRMHVERVLYLGNDLMQNLQESTS